MFCRLEKVAGSTSMYVTNCKFHSVAGGKRDLEYTQVTVARVCAIDLTRPNPTITLSYVNLVCTQSF